MIDNIVVNTDDKFKRAIGILYTAKQNGIDILLNNGQLQIKVPDDKDIDKDLLQQIRDHKQLLIEFLSDNTWQAKTTVGNYKKVNRYDRNSIQHVPLSFSQERLWFIHQMEGSVQYHSADVLKLEGQLNITALSSALQAIVNRHEVLRTVIREEEGETYQFVKEKDRWQLQITDNKLQHRSEEGIQEYIDQFINEPFDLLHDDMLRVQLIVLSKEEHIMVVTMHHIASDGWSRSLFINELAALYQSYAESSAVTLPPLELQYADYAIWQRHYLQDELIERKLQYWKEKLQDVSPLQLPSDFPRPAVQSSRGTSIDFTFSKVLSEQLQQLSQQQGTTLFMTLLAAFKVLLYRYSGQEDICVGTSVADRQQPEIENLIGFFVNTLALRSEVRGELSFTELLQQVKTTTLEAYEHVEVPFEKVVGAVVKERDLSRSPLFQVMLVLNNTVEVPELFLGDVVATRQPIVHNSSKFDLTFFVAKTPAGLKGTVAYSTDLYEASTIHQLIAHFLELLSSIVRMPSEKIGKLKMLSFQEEQKLREFSSTTVAYPRDKSIVELFEEQAASQPDNVAVVFEGNQLTYRQLNERANQLAHHLLSKGVREETLVPLCIAPSLEMIVGIMGILKAGAAYVPIDPEYPEERINHILEDTNAVVAVTSNFSNVKCLTAAGVDVITVDGDELLAHPTQNIANSPKPHHLAYVIYTSGSTGKPKGVMIEHRNLVDYLFGLKHSIQIDQCASFALVSAFSTDLGNTVLYSSLVFGGALHLFSKEMVRNAEMLHHYFNVRTIDCIKIVPSHWKALAAEWGLLLPAKLLVFGGEALPTTVIEEIKASGAQCSIINHYGPTETTVGKLLHFVNDNRLYKNTVPIGRPFSNTQAYVLTKDQVLSPVGIPGELYIGGDGVARGYLNNHDLTKKKIVTNPFSKEGASRLYRTGDLVKYLPDGQIEFIGRIDEQVKIRGYRIELGEIEAAIKQSGLIEQAVVLARENDKGDKQLVGYVVTDGLLNREAVVSYLKHQLPEYMMPSLWVEMESLPLLANGKIDKKALPDPHHTKGTGDDNVAPQNEVETKLVDIWQRVLDVESVGVNDNFFELGGHSLLAIQLISIIRRQLEVDVTIGDIFDYPTIKLLAAHFRQQLSNVVLPAIKIQSRPERLPLSFGQERLWFIDQREGGVQYHRPEVFRMRGELNRDLLASSLQSIIQRHEVLRTSIIQDGSEVYQHIKQKEGWQLEVIDGTHFQHNPEGLQQYIDQLINAPFNLSNDYMLRAHLIILDKHEHILVITVHHIAFDGWSLNVLYNELSAFYTAYVHNQPCLLSSLELQYADYAIWQRRYMQGELLEKKLHYWKEKLQDVAPLQLPTDFPRPAVQTSKGAVTYFTFNKDLSEKLKLLSQQQGVTLFMTLLAAFKVLLYRYSGQEDICVGTPIAGRQQPELESLIGFFINTLALRSEVKEELFFTELLQQVRATTLEAYEHQEVPFEKVVETVVKERDLSRSPLFQVLLTLHNTPEVPQLRLAELQLQAEDIDHTISKFDLTLNLRETPTGLRGAVEYCTDLYDETTIKRMVTHYEQVLKAVIEEPQQRVGTLQMITAAEERQLLYEFNDTKADYSEEKTIVTLFEKQAEKTPETIAIVFEQDQLNYQQLNARGNQLAHYLRNRGVREETLVPICFERSIEMIVGILGILKAGGAYVPIDPEYPAERISYILQDTGAAMVLSSEASRSKLSSTASLDIIAIDEQHAEISKEPSGNVTSALQPSNLAYVIYTSGSTGTPKGVMIEHRSLLNYLLNTKTQYVEEQQNNSGSFVHFSYAFDASLTALFMPLLKGKAIVIASEQRVNVFEDPGFHNNAPYDFIKITPSHLPLLQATIQEGKAKWLTKKLVIGGEALQTAQLTSFFDKGVDVEIINEYGPTEATVGCTVYQFNTKDATNKIRNSKVPIGKPISNTQIYILDNDQHLVPIGVMGEVYIGGLGVARGYLNREELTKEKFISNPFKAGDRLYATGDMGRWLHDGNIEYLGRIDDQVKIRGYRIELGEIESVAQQSELLQECVVVTKEDQQGNKQLVGYLVPNANYDKEALTTYLSSKLPDYMVPSLWIELEALPLTTNAKVNRKALPDPNAIELFANQYVAPRNDVETKLSVIWEELLDIEKVGVHDNFFEMGGHSLLVIQVVSAIRKELSVELSISDVFDHPTLSELAEHLQVKNKGVLLPPIVPQSRPDLIPLSFAQERLWFIDQLEGSAHYHVPAVLRLKGKLDTGALQPALQSIVQRHEVLRTVFRESEELTYQHVLNEDQWRLTVTDGVKYQHNPEILRKYIEQLINVPFDLSNDYMLRADLITLDEEEQVLVLVLHHIASDGWSRSVLVKEVAELYSAFQENRQHVLSPLPVQYADYAIWQRQYLQGELLERKLQYWKEKLSGVSPLQLPTDFPRPAVQSTKGAVRYFTIPRQLTEKLQQFSHEQGTTLFMTLLAAFKVLLYRYSGQEDICVGTPIAGRTAEEIEDLIGFFVNTLALRSEVRGELSFTELLQQVKTTTLEAYEHGEVPFEKVVEAAVRERDMSRSPLFQVMMVWQNTPDMPEFRLGDTVLTREEFVHDTAKFDLSMFLSESADGLRGGVEYCTDLFSPSTAKRMINHFQELLNTISKAPTQPIGELQMLSADEERQLLVGFNDTDVPYPAQKTVIQLFEDQSANTPNEIGLVFEEEQLTYQQLNEKANQLAHYLIEKGLGKETLVPICIERSPEMIIGVLAILKAGCTYVPIDPEYPEERIRYMLEESAANIVLSTTQSHSCLALLEGARLVNVDQEWPAIATQPYRNLSNSFAANAESLVYVLYTSGSTGRPKGVQMRHRSMVNLLVWQQKQFTRKQQRRVLQFASLNFDVSFQEIFSTLCFGSTLYLIKADRRIEMVEVYRDIQRYSLTHLFIPVVVLQNLCEFVQSRVDAELQVEEIIVAGEQLKLTDEIREIVTQKSVRLVNQYGPTEAHVVSSFKLDKNSALPALPPIGKPIDNTRLYILSKERRPVPVGVQGELYIGGVQVAQGYLNNAELTTERFVQDCFSGDITGRLYRTGDLARWIADGNIEYLGRCDDQFKIRGYRVEPAEIESILQNCSGVSQAVVTVSEDSMAQKHLVGYVVPNGIFNREVVISYLKLYLPEYMIPQVWMELDHLPLTNNGKVNRKALPRPRTVESDQYLAPQTDIERLIAEVWKELLHLDKVGLRDNFFELGGHSLMAMRLIAALRKKLQIELSLRNLFQFSTVATLSRYIEVQKAMYSQEKDLSEFEVVNI